MSRICTLLVVVAIPGIVHADEPTLKSFTSPGRSRKDEPLAKQYSLEKAVSFLDNVALDWTKNRTCFSCHTNYAYLYARPMISADVPAHVDIRRSLEDLVGKRWVTGKPRWDAEVVTAAAALAHNDAHTTKKLHPLTKTALDRMWTVQQKDGGIRWLKLNQPPMEFDDHYGVTLAALAVGVAPEGYADTEPAKQGLDRLRGWLKANPPRNLHHKAMLLWVSTYLQDFQSPTERKTTIKEMLSKQLPDGGWSAVNLGDWKRSDDGKSDPTIADGYGTGFTIYVLRRAGVPADDPALVKGIAWLKSNQRESGRWFTRSLVNDNNHHLLTDVGSAFAVMAIQACEEPTKSADARKREEMRKMLEEIEAKAEATERVKALKAELANVVAGLEKANRMDLLLLNPKFVGRSVKNNFHGYAIIKTVSMAKSEQRKELINFLAGSLHWNELRQAICFNPRHGLRVVDGNRTIELLICFECHRMTMFVNGKAERDLTLAAENHLLVERILRDTGN